jgi:hypothetical protein
MSDQIHAPVAFTPGEKVPGTHWIRSWVNLRDGEVKILDPIGTPTSTPPVVQSVVNCYTSCAAPALNNSIQFFIIYLLNQQPQGQLQTQHSVDTGNLHYGQTQHKVKVKLQASTGGKHINTAK